MPMDGLHVLGQWSILTKRPWCLFARLYLGRSPDLTVEELGSSGQHPACQRLLVSKHSARPQDYARRSSSGHVLFYTIIITMLTVLQ
jgi:hypothetical protein